MHHLPRQLFLSGVVAAASLLVACSGDSYDSQLAAARAALAKKDNAAAVIHLKNALQKQDGGEARFLLGQAFLNSGDARAASVELGKAAQQKFDPARLAPVSARALLAEQRFKDVVAQFATLEPKDAEARADLKTSLAIAQASLGDAARADASMAEALKAMPHYAPAQVLQVRVKARAGDYPAALKGVDELLARDPKMTEAWRLKGDLLVNSKAPREAIAAAYRQAVDTRPSDMAAQASLMNHLLEIGDVKAANEQLVALKKVLPTHPQTRYFDAVLAYERKDLVAARELAAPLLKAAPENLRVVQLAGAIEFELKSYVRAQELLQKAVAMAPGLRDVRRMLAQSYLLTAQPDKAVATLEPEAQKPDADAPTLALAGEAALQANDPEKSRQYFTRAAALNPADARSRTVLALGKPGASAQPEALIDELKQIAGNDSGTVADLALIRAQLQRRQFAQALKSTEALEAKQPKSAMPINLRGMVQLAMNDAPAARQTFERALKVDPLFFPPTAMLATLDMAEKKPDAAMQRFKAVLAADPTHLRALLALAELRERAGAPNDEVTAQIAAVVKLHPAVAAPRLALIQHHLQHQDMKLALAAAQDGLAAMPDNADMLEALGRVQAASGDLNQAIDAFNKLARVMRQSPLPYQRLAETYVTQKKWLQAVEAMKQALQRAPDLAAAQRRLSELQLAAGDTKDALASAAALQKRKPDGALGPMLEGDAQASLKAWPAAVAAYKRSLAKAPDSEVTRKLHASLVASNAAPEADKLAAAWLKAHPDDAPFLFYLGSAELMKDQYAAADAHFQQVLALRPDDVPALNNRAWLTLKMNKPGALPIAEKANQLQPNEPAIMDTLSMALEADNQLPKALALQKRALEIEPANHMLRLRLAKLYLKSGDKEQGRAELQRLARIGPQFPARAEVTQLLATL